MYCKQESKEFADFWKLYVRNKFGSANGETANCTKYWIKKIANCHTCGRSANGTNFVNPQICGFSEARGKMIHEKNPEAKNLVTLSFKAKHKHTQECTDVTSQNLIYYLLRLSL